MRKLVVDFVLHDGGVAADRAAHARPGDRLAIGGSWTSFVVRNDLDSVSWSVMKPSCKPWVDAQEIVGGNSGQGVHRVASLALTLAFITATELDLKWADRSAGQSLVEAVKLIATPQRQRHIFITGEAIVSASLRDHFIGLSHNPDLIKAAGYLAPRRVRFLRRR